MLQRYEIIYDYEDEHNICETFDTESWTDLKEYLKQMRKNGCYNIDASFLYEYEEVL